jgi:glycosyltransferase involved in cell wall biosynthesis
VTAAKPGRLVIDGRPFQGGYSGYTTYLVSIIEPLLERGFEITLLTRGALNPAHTVAKRCIVVQLPAARDWLWEQRVVPRHLAQTRPDLYLAGANKGLPWRKNRHTRYVLGLLDVIPYKFPRFYLTSLRFIVKELRPVAQLISVLRADAIITISAQSAVDIQALFRRPATSLLLRLKPKPVRAASESKPQFVYVGGVDRRKKVDVLLRAFAMFKSQHPEYNLMLIGRGYQAFDSLMAELGVSEAVVKTGFVDEDTKFRLIAESTALVYPSLYEGYGLAIAEGFMAGVPVVAGAGGSQAEVGGEGVILVDPTSQAEIAAAMEQTLDETVRTQLAKGRWKQWPVIFGDAVENRIGQFFEQQVEMARRP